MKLASLKQGGRDGALLVVNKDLTRAVKVSTLLSPSLSPPSSTSTTLTDTLILAVENWREVYGLLNNIYQHLCEESDQDVIRNSFPLDFHQLSSPLPRSPQWLDGSAYLPHVRRVRKARGAEMPESFLTDPLMYQGASDTYLSPLEAIPLCDEDWGCDFEAEIAVITDDVPLGIKSHSAHEHITLIMLVNDISLRNLIPNELAKGFGFLHGKPSSSFSPIAVTPDELDGSWENSKVHLPLCTYLNDRLMGEPNAGDDMQFNFSELIAHAATSRSLAAGTIIGSGTVSNADEKKGVSCLVEKRVIEIVKSGKATTPFLKHDDIVRIEMRDTRGHNIFGSIEQRVKLEQ
ncbi:MAG: fumarylacetoacetate hydrolase family protein [Ectothiorhodospiraceae bacterium]|nr:fumarylacetoacetate hydrolase family protein [Ectothiorhodospiraceae bacterium]